jgi:5-methyltetrahydrofolate--homocysteine methyltransferase
MDLSDFLNTKTPILLDGAMGTQLESFGLGMGGQFTLTHPEVVQKIHHQYIAAGSNILITNTLTMNRIYIESHNLGVDVQEVNSTGAKLAKSVVGENQYVLGDMSSTGKMLEPFGDLSEADSFEAFKEQATALANGGVDGFIIETVFDLREALCALRACREVASLPVLASIAYSTPEQGGRTIMGDKAADCASALTEAGASAVGANCGDLDPLQMSQIITEFRAATSLPILAQPNAGTPKLIDGQTVFDMPPEEFARGMLECLKNGASLVGGCCGTTPAHISAVADLLEL